MLFFFSFLYRFTPVELAFLAEYAKTMSPVAKALDVLQGETSVQMGWLVPTITTKDQAPAPSCQVKSSHLYLYSAFNNTDCVKALNSIKLEDRVSVMYNNKIKHSIFS